jgi:hypothetical protein
MRDERGTTEEQAGSITGLSLASVLQIVALEKKDFVMAVTSGRQTGSIFFQDGELIDAVSGSAAGMAAMRALLSWPDPTMRITPAVPRPRTIHLPLMHVLLETCQQADEMAVPSEEDAAGEAKTEQLHHGLDPAGIISQLMAIPEVLHSSVLDRFGKIQAQSSRTTRFQDPLKYATLASEAMRNILTEQCPESIALETEAGETLLLVLGPDRAVGLYLNKSVEVKTIVSRAQPLLTSTLSSSSHG